MRCETCRVASKEASYALGANRLQTIGRVLVPASLSGMISAILLGFGRVIGETISAELRHEHATDRLQPVSAQRV